MSRSSSRTRVLFGLALIVAPLLLLAATVVDVTPDADDTEELLRLIAKSPGTWSTGQLLFFLSGLAWIPAGLGIMSLFGHRAPVGRLGGASVLAGGVAIVAVDAAGLYLPELATSGVGLQQQVAIVEATESSAAVITFEIVHVVGLFLGLLVVAAALFRTRLVPVWASLAVVFALVGLVATPYQVVQAAAMALLTLGLGTAGARLSRMSEEDWRDRGQAPDGSHPRTTPAIEHVG